VDYAPAFSWDGTRIAFIRDVGDGEQALLSVRTDGSDFRALTAEPVDILGLTWSPDDQALAFANGDLVVVDADGGGSRVLFLGVRAQHPRWRPPDGSQILFENGSGNAGLYLVGRDGSDLREVRLPDGRQVTDAVVGWTSDGTRLVTSRREPNPDGGLRMRFHVLTVGDDGTVSQDTAIGPRLVAGPSGSFLSPDDRWVIAPVPETRGGDGWRTGIVSLAGGTTVGFGPDFSGEDYTLSWSPDGTTIVVKDRQAGTTWLLDAFSGRRDVQAAWNDPGDRAPTWQRVAP
jgi:Tol biopolymer transport system component